MRGGKQLEIPMASTEFQNITSRTGERALEIVLNLPTRFATAWRFVTSLPHILAQINWRRSDRLDPGLPLRELRDLGLGDRPDATKMQRDSFRRDSFRMF